MNGILAAFANALVLGALLTVAVGVLVHVLPKRALNAATRYLVWWVTLALVIASPLLYLADATVPPRLPDAPASPAAAAAPKSELKPPLPAVSRFEKVPEPTSSGRPLGERPSSVSEKDVRPAGPSAFPVRLTGGVVAQLLFLTLLSSSALMAARMAVASLMLEHRKRRSLPAPAHLQGRVEDWLARCGSIRKDVRLLSSSEICTPVAVGPYRPAILIPSSLFDRLADWELEPLGLHEAAHLARRDDYALLLQRAIEAVFVWNPLVRWITRRIELEREIACDDLVVAITGEPREYASCLTNMAELSGRTRRSLVAAGATQQGKQLGRRVETLLDKSRQRATRVLRLRAAPLIVAQIALVFWAAAMPGVIIFADSGVQQTPAGLEEAITVQAIRLDTVEAGHGFADMQPLRKVIGNSRIVALGEATHGTREFFQLKHRMLEFLATEMGFTIFSIEANMPEAYRLNDFVLNGRGDPKQLLKGMYFWTWDTEEVLDMILWMRDFNKSGKGRVEFTGFDMQTPDVALGIVTDFVAKNDPDYLSKLNEASSQVKSAARQMTARPGFGLAAATFPIQQALGKRVRYSGYIKTAGVTDGFAGLWWRVDGKGGQVLAFDNMDTSGRGVKGSTDWKRYEIDLPVAADAVNINFGVLLTGDGTAWFDDLTVELDGQPYTDKSVLDLDFESSSPTGFYTGGNGYRVFPDKQTFQTGGQSLQMRYIGGPAGGPKAADGPSARAAWSAVLRHLEGASENYQAKGASSREVQWTIQNARVVLQCLQTLGNEVSRDESMAANVKWILDQSPGAKIVLWAHNGHVARANQGGYQPMGAFLKKMYGDQMVVFGFGFNQGSFQAIQEGKGLRDFTVPPAPPGSLDATFGAAGIPILAFDVRQAPSGSALATWLGQPHQTRSIGAVFSEESAANYLMNLAVSESFDVLLFVEKTTAARKNIAQEAPPIFVPASPAGGDAAKTGAQEYRDEEMGVSFSLPTGWNIQNAARWGDHETTAFLKGQEPKWFTALYFQIYPNPQDGAPEAVMQRLRKDVAPKVAQRISEGMSDYHINMETCVARKVGGRVALSCRGDYTEKGQPMAESLTWVGSEKTYALFFGRAPVADFERFSAQFDQIIETLKIQ